MVTYSSRDDVLREVYASTPQAVDEIVADPELNREVLERVNNRLHLPDRFTGPELSKRLFTLRKRGEDNGGLVRKHRSYDGRNNGPGKPR